MSRWAVLAEGQSLDEFAARYDGEKTKLYYGIQYYCALQKIFQSHDLASTATFNRVGCSGQGLSEDKDTPVHR